MSGRSYLRGSFDSGLDSASLFPAFSGPLSKAARFSKEKYTIPVKLEFLYLSGNPTSLTTTFTLNKQHFLSLSLSLFHGF